MSYFITELPDKYNMTNKTYRTIFISDVHLGTRDSQAEKLNNFLKHNTCETLYLVGDILDFVKLTENNDYMLKLNILDFEL